VDDVEPPDPPVDEPELEPEPPSDLGLEGVAAAGLASFFVLAPESEPPLAESSLFLAGVLA
jgi:hypothetical protein